MSPASAGGRNQQMQGHRIFAQFPEPYGTERFAVTRFQDAVVMKDHVTGMPESAALFSAFTPLSLQVVAGKYRFGSK